jgi:hypothetical protein
VSALLDILEERGVLLPVESPTVVSASTDSPLGLRQNVIRELLNSEREYVASLEKLMVQIAQDWILTSGIPKRITSKESAE